MDKLPLNPKKWGQDTTRYIYDRLGFSNKKLPVELECRVKIDGFLFDIAPGTLAGNVGRRPHRISLVAIDTKDPYNEYRLIPVGRVHQASFQDFAWEAHLFR